MIRIAVGLRHVPGVTCWCRPRSAPDLVYGEVWVHRNVVLRPDTRYRCFQSVALGPPV